MKRYTALCHFGIGLCLAMAPLGAFVAAAKTSIFTPAVVFFALFVFWWLSGSDIIYALLDIESDRKTGIHSVPARLGESKALCVAGGTHLLAFGCAIAVFYLTDGGGLAALALVVMRPRHGGHVPAGDPRGQKVFPGLSIIAGTAGALIPLGRYF